MSFPNKLQSARAPTDQEIFQVRNICTPLKDKPFLILGESTPMTSGKYYNCFGWALQKPIEFVDPANHTEPLNKQWVKQQREYLPSFMSLVSN
jgi:hypothetical protein